MNVIYAKNKHNNQDIKTLSFEYLDVFFELKIQLWFDSPMFNCLLLPGLTKSFLKQSDTTSRETSQKKKELLPFGRS